MLRGADSPGATSCGTSNIRMSAAGRSRPFVSTYATAQLVVPRSMPTMYRDRVILRSPRVSPLEEQSSPALCRVGLTADAGDQPIDIAGRGGGPFRKAVGHRRRQYGTGRLGGEGDGEDDPKTDRVAGRVDGLPQALENRRTVTLGCHCRGN